MNGSEGTHEEGEEVEGMDKGDEKDKERKKRLEVTYDLYSRFWKLQVWGVVSVFFFNLLHGTFTHTHIFTHINIHTLELLCK
ncbi:hypothetical protein EON65_29960 [archaeon]|nr:MAG: hypothetical protein EON65_29960 [archaeon]